MGYLSEAMNRADGSDPQDLGAAPSHRSETGLRLAGLDDAAPPPEDAPPGPSEPRRGPSVATDPAERVDKRLVLISNPTGVLAEEYRALRTSLLARGNHRRHLVHTITSACASEGKTITTLNLGFSLSELPDQRILVVEGDLRLPRFASLLDLPQRPGLAQVLCGSCDLSRAVRRLGGSNMSILPAGPPAKEQAVRLLSSSAARNLIKRLRSKYDHVIVDTPPVVELADAGILGALSDEVILVVKMQRTPRPLIEQAIRVLANYNAPVAGLIATGEANKHHGYYHQYERLAKAA